VTRRYTLGLRGREFVIDVHELAADRFEVTVGDETYDVTLSGEQDLPRATITPGYQPAPGASGAARPPAVAATVAPARSAPAAAAAPRTPRPAANASGSTVSAPMPGVILEVHVKAGDRVERGQQIAVLEAMKMHNLIGAPRAGTIGEVCVTPGQAVGHGDALVRYAES
jgi:glutaconyl-CoA/methylmalonyl-CoA decarboxylase subunit gamma